MQEIAILLSSLAGVATAFAAQKRPKNKTQIHSLGASSHVKSQIRSLSIEKDILAKTISRLHQQDTGYSKIQQDRLLTKYQHRMGMVLAELEKLEQSSQHPDLGAVGDSLITLMDQKLSKLDSRLEELSAKISIVKTKDVDNKKSEAKDRIPAKTSFNFTKPAVADIQPAVADIQPAVADIQPAVADIQPAVADIQPAVADIQPSSKQQFELTTLTSIPNLPKTPPLQKESENHMIDVKDDRIKQEKEEMSIVLPVQSEYKIPESFRDVAQPTTKPLQKQDNNTLSTMPSDGEADEDSEDLDKIKDNIKKIMNKLDQAEVE